MLVRRLPILALLAGLPIVLANCSSDSSPGATAGAPSSSAGSSAAGSNAAGQPSAGAPAAGSPSSGGGGSANVAGGGAGGAAAGSANGGSSTGGAAVAGGSSAGAAGKAGGGSGGSGGGTTGGTFTLTSAEVTAGMTIPEVHTCDGGGGTMMFGVSPSFKWANPPAGTMSYAFFMIDWTLTMGATSNILGYHSMAVNIPTTITEVAKGWTTVTGAKVINGGYLGPCPAKDTSDPSKNATDQYHMIVMAMPMASYTTTGSASAGVKAAYEQLKPLALATAEIIAPYKRK
ncbi:MAG TPA: hypothetical protein VJV79_35010 [Polyangiaceae bacterium]|nr:hypothetical protein [Polyangiaceae bacterium]